jgi:hypothetical protein
MKKKLTLLKKQYIGQANFPKRKTLSMKKNLLW